MFRLFFPTIIRKLRSLTKVTLVIYVYDVNGMMAACHLLYMMVLDMVLPVFPVSFVSCEASHLQLTKDTGRRATPYPKPSCSLWFEHKLGEQSVPIYKKLVQ